MAFLDHEGCLPDANTVTAEHPLSLIGAAALWSGLSVGVEALRDTDGRAATQCTLPRQSATSLDL